MRRPTGVLHRLLLGLLLGHGTSRLPSSAEEELATDLEAPGVLAGAALRLATAHNEVVFVVTGPDATSMQMANNSLVTLAGVGLRGHTMMMADSFATCQKKKRYIFRGSVRPWRAPHQRLLERPEII